MKKVGPKAKNHPEIVKGYCECLIDKTTREMSKKQYLDDLSMPKREQDDKFNPMFQGCKINVNRLLDSAEKQGK
jgi:hypothetical protein